MAIPNKPGFSGVFARGLRDPSAHETQPGSAAMDGDDSGRCHGHGGGSVGQRGADRLKFVAKSRLRCGKAEAVPGTAGCGAVDPTPLQPLHAPNVVTDDHQTVGTAGVVKW